MSLGADEKLQMAMASSRIKFIAVCSKGDVPVSNVEVFFNVAKSSTHWSSAIETFGIAEDQAILLLSRLFAADALTGLTVRFSLCFIDVL